MVWVNDGARILAYLRDVYGSNYCFVQLIRDRGVDGSQCMRL